MADLQDLYTRYARDVHRFAWYLSGDSALADDLTSEAFLRAWHSTTPIREATVKAYLFAIVRNVYVSEMRRSTRFEELSDTLPSPAASPDETLDVKAATTRVLAALHELPELDRAALLMRAQGDVPYDDIAQSLGLSVSAAKVRVHRARVKLAALVPRSVLP